MNAPRETICKTHGRSCVKRRCKAYHDSAKEGILDQVTLKTLLSYDAETGEFVWLAGTRCGHRAGTTNRSGYRQIEIAGRLYYAHRLAWLYMTGGWPPNVIDHQNGVPGDNRWTNIRSATHTQNSVNRRAKPSRKGGLRGAFYRERAKRWQGYVIVNGRHLHLGYFDTAEEAHAAHMAKSKEIYGEFVRDE